MNQFSERGTQDRAGQGRHGRAGQGRAGQMSGAGQGRTGQGRAVMSIRNNHFTDAQTLCFCMHECNKVMFLHSSIPSITLRYIHGCKTDMFLHDVIQFVITLWHTRFSNVI